MGSVSIKLVLKVLKYLGGYWIFIVNFLLSLGFNLISIYCINYLLEWSKNMNEPDRWQKFRIFSAMIIGRCFLEGAKVAILHRLGVNASLSTHAKMFYRISHAKIHEFLDKIPIGRIINRFSSDMEMIDIGIFTRTSYGFYVITSMMSSFVILCWKCTWVSIVLVFIFVIVSFFIQRKYIGARRELVRLQSITKSPIVSTFSDTIKGLAEIRSMKLKNYFMEQLRFRQNENLKNGVLMGGTQAWFNLRVAIGNILMVQLPCYAFLIYSLTQSVNLESVI